MGDNVIDDAQVLFEFGEYQAGGDEGLIILENVTLTSERPTNGYSGIGNEGETAVGYGTTTHSMDHEQMLNEEAAEMLETLYNNAREPVEVSVVAGDALDMSAAKFDWNELETSFENDGDQMVSVSGKVRGLDVST